MLLLAIALAPPIAGAQFDHGHRAWTELLQRHVVVIDAGRASRVRYDGFAGDRERLGAYLARLSSVGAEEFGAWGKAQRLAFLINAYNAYTVEKILTRYPDLGSIRDFGTVIGNPWKDRFFALLGRKQSLDGLEHEIIRAPGIFDEPRVHFALNCASVGCPMLREEAYVAARLERQLEDQAERFLADRSRNRYSAQHNALEVSRIFDWYAKDFTAGTGEIRRLGEFFARYAPLLAEDAGYQRLIRERKVRIRFLDYDWSLNDARR